MADESTTEAAAAGAAAEPAPAQRRDGPRTIPYERFAEVYDDAKAARAQRDALAAEVEALKGVAAKVATAEQRAEAAEAIVAAERAQMAEEMGLFRAGITDEEGVQVARFLYQQTPAESRPEGGITAWLSGFGAGEGKVAPPRALSPYLTPATIAAAPGIGGPLDTAGTVQAPPASGSVVTAEAIRKATEKGRLTNDWSEYLALKQHVLSSVAAKR